MTHLCFNAILLLSRNERVNSEMKLGYVRVSTEEQNEARQIEALVNMGIERSNIYIDKQSGKDANRPQLKYLLNYVRHGDIVYTESISRIARNTKDLLSIIEELQKKNVHFVSKKEAIDTTTPTGKFMLTVFGAMAELERESILERQREGIEIAKRAGKYTGRQPIQYDRELFTQTVTRWKAGEITARKAMQIVGLKPNTFYRRVKELEHEG